MLALLYFLMIIGLLVFIAWFSSFVGTGMSYFLNEVRPDFRGYSHSLCLRRVLCEGKEDEDAIVLCCAGPKSTRDYIVIPGPCLKQCDSPNCDLVCGKTLISLGNEEYKFLNENSFDAGPEMNYSTEIVFKKKNTTKSLKKVSERRNNTSKQPKYPKCFTNFEQKVEIPGVVLNLVETCNALKNWDFFCNERLRDMCRTTEITLDEFLKLVEGKSLDSNVDKYHLPELLITTDVSIPSPTTNYCDFTYNYSECDNHFDNSLDLFSKESVGPTTDAFFNGIPENKITFINQERTFTERTWNIFHKTKCTSNTKHTTNIIKSTTPFCCCTCKRRMKYIINHMFPKRRYTTVVNVPKSADFPGSELHKFSDSDIPVEEYVGYLNNKFKSIFMKFKQAEWNFETNLTQMNRQMAMMASLQMRHFQRRLKEVVEPLKSVSVPDPQLKRQIKLLYLPGMSSLPDIESAEFEQVLFGMQTLYSSATVVEWEHKNKRVSLNPVVSKVMSSSSDPAELEYYWLEWRKATGRKIRPLFEHYVLLMDRAAKANGFNDAGEMWTRRYETEDFMESLAGHYEDLLPLYKELHAYVRHRLHELYGNVAGSRDVGLIPVHLTGDIWGLSWKNLYSICSPFTDVEDYMHTNLIKKKITPRIMAKMAQMFFHSLGFSNFTEEFWEESIFTKSNISAMSCEPSAWDMGTGTDFRIKICGEPNMESFFEIHRLFALAEYYKQYSLLPFVFRDAANPGFYEGVAGAVVLSAQSRIHLKRLNLVQSTDTPEANLNQLMRIALDKVAFLPYSYIVDLWRYKVFKGELTASNYNAEWWQLRLRYQGVSPPAERTEEDLDIGSKLHIAASKPYIKYFFSTIMEFQVHEALCRSISFSGALHECDITSNAVAGHSLRKVMGLGASKHWKEALQELTGSRKLNSASVLRYFDPLYKWLKETNQKHGITAGWQT